MELRMTAPLSQDLRQRIVRFVEGGASARGGARRFEVSPSAAVKLMQRVHETGSTAPAKVGGYRRPILEAHADTLRALAKSKPGITAQGDPGGASWPRHHGARALDHFRDAPSA